MKLACVRTNAELGFLPVSMVAPLETACREMMAANSTSTSSSMPSRAGQGPPRTWTSTRYWPTARSVARPCLPATTDVLGPVADVNRHQSTNDTYPTALKVAAICSLKTLEASVVALIEAARRRNGVGRRRQDRPHSVAGRGADHARPSHGGLRRRLCPRSLATPKCEERLRVVNLGGTAIGTGLGAPRQCTSSAPSTTCGRSPVWAWPARRT